MRYFLSGIYFFAFQLLLSAQFSLNVDFGPTLPLSRNSATINITDPATGNLQRINNRTQGGYYLALEPGIKLRNNRFRIAARTQITRRSIGAEVSDFVIDPVSGFYLAAHYLSFAPSIQYLASDRFSLNFGTYFSTRLGSEVRSMNLESNPATTQKADYGFNVGARVHFNRFYALVDYQRSLSAFTDLRLQAETANLSIDYRKSISLIAIGLGYRIID